MSDLVAFLNARLDEEQGNAEHALAQWPDTHFTIDPGSLVIVKFHRDHDPARVLREVEAKRRIIAEHRRQVRGNRASCISCHYGNALGASWPCATAAALAAVYLDHPDYDPDWA